jgi:hypothetical protein
VVRKRKKDWKLSCSGAFAWIDSQFGLVRVGPESEWRLDSRQTALVAHLQASRLTESIKRGRRRHHLKTAVAAGVRTAHKPSNCSAASNFTKSGEVSP